MRLPHVAALLVASALSGPTSAAAASTVNTRATSAEVAPTDAQAYAAREAKDAPIVLVVLL